MKVLLLSTLLLCFVLSVLGSSHSEAPGTAQIAPADITDLWAFRSYESGRQNDYVTFLLNVYPLQSPYGGPNYFSLSDSHFYELYVDSNSDGFEDYVFQWIYGNSFPSTTPQHTPQYIYLDDNNCSPVNVTPDSIPPVQPPSGTNTGVELTIGNGNQSLSIQVALKVVGFVLTDSARDAAAAAQGLSTGGSPYVTTENINWNEYYSINLIAGNVSSPTSQNLLGYQGMFSFPKPFDYAGQWTFGLNTTYENYATSSTFLINLDLSSSSLFNGKCSKTDGRAWMGQRNEPFYISLGRIFDYLNLVPVVLNPFLTVTIDDCLSNNDLREKNVDTLALEIPYTCFGSPDGILNVWAATRRLFHNNGDNSPSNPPDSLNHVAGIQFSRMGNPLVNELVIGLIDKIRFSRQTPRMDANGTYGFASYVTHPTFPQIISNRYLNATNVILGTSFGTLAPPVPRSDLVAVFLTGIAGVNQGVGGFIGEVMRLNTNIAPIPWGNQNPLGIVGALVAPGNYSFDLAGYPNGRRPGDDVVDISLMVMMGAVCSQQFQNAGFFLCPQINTSTAGTPLSLSVPLNSIVLRDGAPVRDIYFQNKFPYFNTPVPGSYLDGAAGNVVQNPTLCYPAGQHGRCAIPATCSTCPTCPTCSGSGTLIPLSFFVLFATIVLLLFT